MVWWGGLVALCRSTASSHADRHVIFMSSICQFDQHFGLFEMIPGSNFKSCRLFGLMVFQTLRLGLRGILCITPGIVVGLYENKAIWCWLIKPSWLQDDRRDLNSGVTLTSSATGLTARGYTTLEHAHLIRLAVQQWRLKSWLGLDTAP